MALFKKRREQTNQSQAVSVQTSRSVGHPFGSLGGYTPLGRVQNRLYDELRLAVPIIDTAIGKIIRLMGTFDVKCGDEYYDNMLEDFLMNISVSGTGTGMYQFLYCYMDSLLCYGNAVGEIVLDNGGEIYALYNVPIENIEVKRHSNKVDTELFFRDGCSLNKVKNDQLMLYTTFRPKAGELVGRSLLEGLPFISNILLGIYSSIEQNFNRVGNVRFSVNYKPGDSETDRAYAKERAEAIAKEWSSAMSSDSVKDFITVGDVDIKVIGADNQILDTNVPVRQMLEQIVAKLGVPPFLLGLSWSSTERMSSQQSDMLTSELESYQNLISPVIIKICRMFLRIKGCLLEPKIEWRDLSLLDLVEGANARLADAQAEKIRWEMERYIEQ